MVIFKIAESQTIPSIHMKKNGSLSWIFTLTHTEMKKKQSMAIAVLCWFHKSGSSKFHFKRRNLQL